MTATLVLPGTAPEAEWLEARRCGITASEIGVLMGLSPWSSPYALYHQKTGDLPGMADSGRLALGRVLEPYIVDLFSQDYDLFRIEGDGRELFAHPGRPWQLATPDRILSESWHDGPLAVLECKTSAVYDHWGDDRTDEIPVHYRCQVLWQMDVMQVTTAYVACLFLPGGQFRVYELTMDDHARADLALMEAEARRFLHRIERCDPPDVDWRPATAAALKRLHPDVEDTEVTIPKGMARAYRRACGQYKTASERKALYENRIRERLGAGHYAVTPDGQRVARRDVYDVREHVRKASHVDKLVHTPPKETT